MNSWEYIEEISLMFSLLALSAFCAASETAYSTAKHETLQSCSSKRFFR